MKRLTECYKLYRELPIFQVCISLLGGPNVDPPRCPGAVPELGGAGGVWPDSPGAAPRHHPPVQYDLVLFTALSERGGGGGAGGRGGGVAEVVTLVTAETAAAETQVM